MKEEYHFSGGRKNPYAKESSNINIIRLENPGDFRSVERLTYEAFSTMNLPGRTRTDEHFLVHIMRNSPAFIPELDFVCVLDGKIVANIMYTKSRIVRPNGEVLGTITFGPVSVLPEYHNRGIGSTIIRHSLEKATGLGYKAVVIVGHEAYYPRFGFRPAAKFGLTMPDGSVFGAFMALELEPGAIGGSVGKWYEDEVYHINDDAFEAFHREFLRREE